MKRTILGIQLVLAWFPVCVVKPASADTNDQLIQLKISVQMLEANMDRMQQGLDERMGVLNDLVTQQTDNLNHLVVAVDATQQAIKRQSTDTAVKVNQLADQVRALHGPIDEIAARLTKFSKQLDDIQALQKTITARTGAAAATARPSSGAPPAGILYDSALGDFEAGKYDLSAQEFSQFLQVYGDNDMAGNAQFYLGEIDSRRGDLRAAIQDYSKVLSQYPGGNKDAPARLKIGYAYLQLGQRADGIKALQSLIARYPESPEAMQAKARLHKLRARQRRQSQPLQRLP